MPYKAYLSYIGCLLLLICAPNLDAQGNQASSFNNDWWKEGQDYYKFTISQKGLYKLNLSDLRSAGLSLEDVSSDQIRLFSMGKEIRLFVSFEGSVPSPEDFILFYATSNDGSLDAQLYSDPEEQQLNTAYSLYTDERPYFLTITKDGSIPLRYSTISNGLNGPGVAPREEYYLHHEGVVYSEFHHKPAHNGRDFIRYSSMDSGEGFGSKLKSKSELKIPIHNLSDFGVDPVLKLRFGTNVHSRSWQILVNDQIVKNIVQTGFGTVQVDQRISRNLLQSSDTVKVTIQSLGASDQKHTIAYYDLSYPRRYIFDQENSIEFHQQASIITRFVEILNTNIEEPLLFNIDQGYFMEPLVQEGNIKYNAPASFSENTLILADAVNGIEQVSSFEHYRYEPIISAADYIIITHKDLIDEGAKSYSDYRASVEGGSYTTQIVDVADLYNHYSFGIKGHPIAIKKYIAHKAAINQSPKFLFIIGKSIEYAELRTGTPNDVSYVPTFGSPGSDNLLISLDSTDIPAMPIGRLAAQNRQQVIYYLDKIIEHENRPAGLQTIEDQRWKKGVVHLSGGSSDIQTLLFNYMNNMGQVISKNKFAADILTFRKTSSDPIQTVKSEQIINTINGGSSILSFFGHSAVGTFDFRLEDPSKYQNKGKNPIILSLGCHSGNIHTPKKGISEDFVLEKEMGATHFLASSGTAYINPQYNIGLDLYQLLGQDMYGEAIGTIVHETLVKRAQSKDISIKTLVQQMTLHGDPAYKVGTFLGPDLTLDYQSVAISPSIINSTTKTINLSFDVVNIGNNTKEPLEIIVVHEYNNGQNRDTVYSTIPAPSFTSRVMVELTNPGFDAVGNNQIFITLDPNQLIRELPDDQAEKNNKLISSDGELGYQFFVLDNTANPVYPVDFGIINRQEDFVLNASLNNAFDFNGSFHMQVDTSEAFDSPLLRETVLNAQSSYLQWAPNIDKIDGVVYYWRVASEDDNILLKNKSWKTRSFLYNTDITPGWNQSHYYQWLKDDFYKMDLDSIDRSWSFAERTWDIRIKNKMKDVNDFWVFVNNSPWKSLNPIELAPGISIFAWHKDEIIVANKTGHDFGSIPFSPDGFIFKTNTPQERQNVIKLLESMPDGARVFLHTLIEDEHTTLNIDQWEDDRQIYGTTLFDVLESYGSTRVRELLEKGAVPYTLIFDKGKGLVIEDVASTIEETIDLSSVGRSVWNEGTINSTLIGPAQKWLKLEWSEDKKDNDITQVNIYGVTSSGGVELLRQVKDQYTVDISTIDAKKFDYLYLEYVSKDVSRTTAQLNYWRVHHQELSDAILYSSTEKPFTLLDTLYEGEDLELTFDVQNIGDVAFEPMLIRYRLIDKDNHQVTFVSRAQVIPANSSVSIVEKIKTDGLGGEYQVSIEINPGEEQPERTTINNFGISQIYILPDERNPFLDVTIDGQHIRNGYITDGKPVIVVSLFDPQAKVLLNNPKDFKIKLFYPELLVRNITESDPDVSFIPALSLEDNMARFVIQPNLTVKGEYTLEVQAEDRSGNKAGEYAYQVKFRVDDIVESSRFTVSPNPFNSTTTLDFFLGGRVIPDIFYIRLYTAEGQLVRRLEKSDLGGLFYGSNKYIWDGTDTIGNEMPSGVYYYEIVNSADNSSDKKTGSIIKMR